ncbi:MAG: YggS family pyridoxal phosphate-dependent enzyme [Planctomycetaceae bacterium]|nr:YggS family pyridoxal phosphate-dependent enzyme [Planctomycetaceae bacterium]
MSDPAVQIADNVARVRSHIADAAARVGRSPDAVTLVAVTKYVSAEMVRPLVAADCFELGESRPQKLWDKAAALADLPVRWHMIGHLQRNKVRKTLPLVTLIHSIDSPQLLTEIDEQAEQPVRALLEVNISGEAAKHGFTPESLERFLPELAKCRHVTVHGLMAMAALEGGPDEARRDFAALRQLRDRLQTQCPPGMTLNELSMGMSNDFEAAIEEGATLVRVGSALFEGVLPSG